MNTEVMPHVSESTHWYWPDGRPAYDVPGAKGQPVRPDVRHARKLGLLPSVTTVMRVFAKPALERWLRTQYVLAALTLPRHPGESDSSYMQRLDEDARAWTEERADEGTAIHKAIEQAWRGELYDQCYAEHVSKVMHALNEIGPDFVGDFKTKDTLEGKTERTLFYDEHIMQLAAYRSGVAARVPAGLEFEVPFATTRYGGRIDVLQGDPRKATLASVMIGMKPAAVMVKVWTPEECDRGLELFELALRAWQLKNLWRVQA